MFGGIGAGWGQNEYPGLAPKCVYLDKIPKSSVCLHIHSQKGDSKMATTQVQDDHITTPHAGQVRFARERLLSHFHFKPVPPGLENLHKIRGGFFRDYERPWNSTKSTGSSTGCREHNQYFCFDLSLWTDCIFSVQVDGINHYPPANFEPHLSHLANFLWPGAVEENSGRLQAMYSRFCSS